MSYNFYHHFQLAIALFNAHVSTHSGGAVAATSKAEKLQRPKVSQGMLEESWLSFTIQWKIYKEGTNLQAAKCPRQLLHCCDQDVLELVLQSDPNISSKTEDLVLQLIKSMAVIPVAMGVRRAEMLAMKQDSGEPIRGFAAKIQGKSATCAFTTPCPGTGCEQVVDFTNVITKYVLENGIEDEGVKKILLAGPISTPAPSQSVSALWRRKKWRETQ